MEIVDKFFNFILSKNNLQDNNGSFSIDNILSSTNIDDSNSLSLNISNQIIELITKHNQTRLKLHLRKGLIKNYSNIIEILHNKNIEFDVVISIFNAGDAGIIKEGKFIFSPEYKQRLKHISNICNIFILFEPLYIIEHLKNTPIEVYKNINYDLSLNNIYIKGLCSSFSDNIIDKWEQLLSYKYLKLVDGSFHNDLKFFSEFNAPAIVNHINLENNILSSLNDNDGINKIVFKKEIIIEKEYSNYLQSFIISMPEYNIEVDRDILYINSEKIKFITKMNYIEILLIGNVSNIISDFFKNTQMDKVQIILDYSIVSRAKKEYNDDIVRKLPFPYKNYISINSDIDWSLLNHHEKNLEIFNKYGLSYASSVYPDSDNKNWVSLFKQDKFDTRLLRHLYNGSIDTIHGFISSNNIIKPNLVRSNETLFEFSSFYIKNNHQYFIIYIGEEASIEIIVNTKNKEEIIFDEISNISYDKSTQIGTVVIKNNYQGHINSLKVKFDKKVKLEKLETIYFLNSHFKNILKTVYNYGFKFILQTNHGGGENVIEYGSYFSSNYRNKNTNMKFKFTLDRPNQPYYFFEILKKYGVLFLNPIGFFASKNIKHINDTFKVDTTVTEGKQYIFQRFTSQIYKDFTQKDNMWLYGKRASTVQALSTNIRDVIYQCKQKENTGAIIYTHLQHRLGNLMSMDQGWSEEVTSSLKLLSGYSNLLDKHSELKMWYANTSTLLIYSLVRTKIEKNIIFEENTIFIRSCTDEVISSKVPENIGWLHNITIYIENLIVSDMKVFFDNKMIEYIQINLKTTLEPKSMTLIDYRSKILLLPMDSQYKIINKKIKLSYNNMSFNINPIKLTNISHLIFSIALSEISLIKDLSIILTTEHNEFTIDIISNGKLILEWILVNGFSNFAIAIQYINANCKNIFYGTLINVKIDSNIDKLNIYNMALIRPNVSNYREGEDNVSLSGQLKDIYNRPIANRKVKIMFNEVKNITSTSDENGIFFIDNIPVYTKFILDVDSYNSETVIYENGRNWVLSNSIYDLDIIIIDNIK